jgi:signal transduction histidine kinase
VYRSLRFQLTVGIISTVAVGIGVSQWFSTQQSERMLERDLEERVSLVVTAVESLWDRAEPEDFRREIVAVANGQRNVSAIDVFRVDGEQVTPAETTRSSDDLARRRPLTTDEVTRVLAGNTVSVPLSPGDWDAGWSFAAPVRRGGDVKGIVQMEVHPIAFTRLKGRLRALDSVVFACSAIALIFFLAALLERGVARPVTTLVDGMQRVEQGDLSTRVTIARGGEFSFLARGFNRMIERLGELTAGLEARVRHATEALATKNRELQSANERLSQVQLELARAERLAAHGYMAAAVAHELGTPLNSVLGYTQLLLRAEATPERVQKLSIIESQIQRMTETIRGMLDQARGSAVQRVPVTIAPLVDEALTLVAPRLDGGGLSVERHVDPYLPAVSADPTGLRQVLINLLTNAIDATGGGGRIVVSAAATSEGSQPSMLEMAVRDTGRGMTAEQIRRATEPFYTTKAPGAGTGLGLAIVDHIVRAHRGRLQIESAPGAGTTVRVRLPLEA